MRVQEVLIVWGVWLFVALASTEASSSDSGLGVTSAAIAERQNPSDVIATPREEGKRKKPAKRRRKRKRPRSDGGEDKTPMVQGELDTAETIGEAFQVGSVYDLEYLTALHGLPTLKGRVRPLENPKLKEQREKSKDQDEDAPSPDSQFVVRSGQRGKQKPEEIVATKKKLLVEDEIIGDNVLDQTSEDGSRFSDSTEDPLANLKELNSAPYSSLPHKYERQPTSLDATHTYVDPNSPEPGGGGSKRKAKAASIGGDDSSNGIENDVLGGGGAVSVGSQEPEIDQELLERLKNLLALREEAEALDTVSNIAVRKESEDPTPTAGSILTPISTLPSPTANGGGSGGDLLSLDYSAENPFIDGPSGGTGFGSGTGTGASASGVGLSGQSSDTVVDTFVASKKLSEVIPPSVAAIATLLDTPVQFPPEFQQIPSQPTFTNYGVAVDFAGSTADNPLLQPVHNPSGGQQQQQQQQQRSDSSTVVTYNTDDRLLLQPTVNPSQPDLFHAVQQTASYTVGSGGGGTAGGSALPVRPYSPNYGDTIFDAAVQWPGSVSPASPSSSASAPNSLTGPSFSQAQTFNSGQQQSSTFGSQPLFTTPPPIVYSNPADRPVVQHDAFIYNSNNLDNGQTQDHHDHDHHHHRPLPPSNVAPPPPRRESKSPSDHEHSAFRQFFAGDGLSAPPPKGEEDRIRNDIWERAKEKDRQLSKNRDRRKSNKPGRGDRNRGRDRERNRDRERDRDRERHRNSDRDRSTKNRKNKRHNRNKGPRGKPKTLQHLQSNRNKEKKNRPPPRGGERHRDKNYGKNLKSGSKGTKKPSSSKGKKPGRRPPRPFRTPFFLLTDDGPSMPIFSNIGRDVGETMNGFLRSRID